MNMIKSKHLKEKVRKYDLNCAKSVHEKLELVIDQIIYDGAQRAVTNKRKTLMGHDL